VPAVSSRQGRARERVLDPDDVAAAVEPLLREAGLPMATLSRPLHSLDEMLSPAVVKVVVDAGGNALYFSRSPIPLVRDGGPPDLRAAAARAVEQGLARKHVGLYPYRRDALVRFAAAAPVPLGD